MLKINCTKNTLKIFQHLSQLQVFMQDAKLQGQRDFGNNHLNEILSSSNLLILPISFSSSVRFSPMQSN